MAFNYATTCPDCKRQFHALAASNSAGTSHTYSGCPTCHVNLRKQFQSLFKSIADLESEVLHKVRTIKRYRAAEAFLKVDRNDNLRSDTWLRPHDIVRFTVDGDDNPILAHRFILVWENAEGTFSEGMGYAFLMQKTLKASRSSTFRLMFENLVLGSECEVRISSTTRAVMQAVIDFCYEAEIEFSEEFNITPEEVLKVAHKYNIQYLVEVCDKTLAERIDSTNTIDMLKLAQNFQLPKTEAAVKIQVKNDLQKYFVPDQV